ncbi:hypothetical protein LOAG_13133 [Loa loa]|uniref:Uncharacterized protein n=1 Tax=Loa loa TaxID=7209 RepID=A0A1S0TJU6_LOALO|nr:hypothetical protein LOAG_13133 [Loa loa]EFO15377.1 hypothetical protein LOAG_13133 [Loa loa]
MTLWVVSITTSKFRDVGTSCLNQCALSVMLISGSLTRNPVHVPFLHFRLSPDPIRACPYQSLLSLSLLSPYLRHYHHYDRALVNGIGDVSRLQYQIVVLDDCSNRVYSRGTRGKREYM